MITGPAYCSLLCQNDSPFLLLYFDGIAGTIVLELFFHSREVSFETRQLFQSRVSFSLARPSP